VVFTPGPISDELTGKMVVDVSAGEDFSLVLCENPINAYSHEVYSMGNNLRG
jgi:hypothetical protein